MFELYAQIDQGNLQERSFLNGSKLATKKKSLLTFFANIPIKDVINHWFLWVNLLRNQVLYFPRLGYLHNLDKVIDLITSDELSVGYL